MFLKKKIAASGLVEVVIALAVIALCFGVVSIIFTRSIMVTTGFEEVRTQTEIQSLIWEQLQDEDFKGEIDDIELQTEPDEFCDSLLVETYLGVQDRILWNQQKLKNE